MGAARNRLRQISLDTAEPGREGEYAKLVRGIDGRLVAERGCRVHVTGAHAAPSGYWLQVAFEDAPGRDIVLHMREGATAEDAMRAIAAATQCGDWPHVIDVRLGDRVPARHRRIG
jgi:hypothetical protein